MKILIINDKYLQGGAEIYVNNLKRVLKDNGNIVKSICFDKNISSLQESEELINIKNYTKVDKLILNLYLYKKIRNVIREFNPNIIILNNINVSPITILKSVAGYKTIQVVHDFGIVCPKATCIFNNKEICNGYKESNCKKECVNIMSKSRLLLYQIKKIEMLRKKYVCKFISPSKNLNNYLLKYGYDSICINNPIEIQNKIEDRKEIFTNTTKKYIYVGGINRRKGILEFAKIFNDFSKQKDVKLTIIGDVENKEDDKELKNITQTSPKITYLGKLKNEDILKLIRDYDFSVVPSIWVENYPTTVLEAMANKILVIGSNRGGIAELLDNNRGYIFDILKKESVMNVLEKTYQISKEEYIKITGDAYNYITTNNSMQNYYLKLKEIIEEVDGRNNS